jgi:ergothioneine biosynthesis protein EgtB
VNSKINIEKDRPSYVVDALQRQNLLEKYKRVRKFSEELCENLEIEDFVIQSMPDVSPTKWHLAHTSWFFEAFLLKKVNSNYKSLNDIYNYLFNSYYVQIGRRFTRAERGMLSRPTVKEVFQFRKFIDEQMLEFFETSNDELFKSVALIIEIGLNHEQQHQELMLTDLKHVLSQNPLTPIYSKRNLQNSTSIKPNEWIEFEEAITKIGHDGNGFYYDNEMPRHKTLINSFEISNRLVTNREYIDFIADGGYKKTELWLSDGATAVETGNWNAPLYWQQIENKWWSFTLNGFKEVNLDEPVCHVSLYEADAYARWADARLLTESEWEYAAENINIKGNFADNKNFHPIQNKSNVQLIQQMYGDVWEWTRSDYCAYPGYKIPPGAIGEYNGKFMSGQNVLRGGSCATSQDHIRKTYRNFFPPSARWQFAGIRLARDIK